MLESIYLQTILGLNSSNKIIRIFAKIFLKLFQISSNIFDPLINYQLNNHNIKLPISHALPIVRGYYPDYANNLGRIAICVSNKYQDLTIIDIGANIGDSVFILRNKVSSPILCIEGDDRFFQILKMNIADCDNVAIKKVFIGDADRQTNKELITVAGTAHFQESTKKVTEFRTLTGILGEEPQFYNSKIIKIDTDGFDLAIIRGAIDWIASTKPVIFFEYDPYFLAKQKDDGISVFPLLQSLGYAIITIYDNFGRNLISLSLTETRQIEDILRYALDRQGYFYYDICAFHREDIDIAEELREVEQNHSS